MSGKRPYEEDVSEALEEKIKKSKVVHEKVKKHTLDSDEEDSDEEQKGKYEILADDDIEGQEDGVAGQDGEVKLTPFNMKEELEEGHFDTEGNYHWDKETVIKDHWLDNIDWVKIKENKDAPLAKSDALKDAPPPFDERAAYQQILGFMQPGETVAKSLRRLGGGASLSASERLKRKKAGLSLDLGGDSRKVTELTEVANRLLTETGNMDVYQETYNYIKNRVEQSTSKANEVLDMYADDFDSKEKERMEHKSEDGSTPNALAATYEKEPTLLWEYKYTKDGLANVNGPFTSEQMQNMVESGKLPGEVWVRKVGSENEFYSSRRVDFDIYT